MKLLISYTKKLDDIKEAFHKNFPFLKIEFFRHEHAAGKPTAREDLLAGDITAGELNPLIEEGTINIHPQDAVATIEKRFQEQFGLPVQIFRKQKEVWIETTKTDQLTLAHQESMGKEASAPQAQTVAGDRYLEDGQYS